VDRELLWKSVLGEIELSVSKGNFATWFRATELLDIDGSHVTIGVPNVFIQNQLEKRFGEMLQTTIEKNGVESPILSFKNIPFIKASQSATPSFSASPTSPESIVPNFTTTDNAPSPTHVSGVTHAYRSGINEKYTFDNFVVGGSNELAYAACRGAAESPGAKYNPLFLYGGVGISKTHLIQASRSFSTRFASRRIPTSRATIVAQMF
jgi:chromosomal replication initiator protein